MIVATMWRQAPHARRTGTVAGMALAPYLAFPFSHQVGLRIQAGALALLLLSVAILAPRGLRWPSEAPRPVLAGLGLWGVAAAWGLGFGLFYGNPPRYVASQTVAMAMLVVGGLSFLMDEGLRPRHLRRGLVIAAVGALILQMTLALGWTGFLAAGSGFRLKLFNDVGIGALAPLVLLVLAASWLEHRDLGSLAGASAALLLVVAEMSRGAWLACLAGGVLLALAMRSWNKLRVARLVLVIVLLAGGAVVLSTWSEARTETVVHLDWERPEESRMETDSLGGVPDPTMGSPVIHATQTSGDWRTLTPGLGVVGHGVEVLVTTLGPPGRHLTLRMEFFDAEGRRIGRSHGSVGGSGEWRNVGLVRALPPSKSYVRVSVWAAVGQGEWTISRLSLRSVPDPLTAWLRALEGRVSELAASLIRPAGDRTLSYRLEESRAVLAAWKESPMFHRITGQGLGALFPFENMAWGKEGRRIVRSEASYIHNLFLFLAFKLGVAGLVALAGLLLLAGWTGLPIYRGKRRGMHGYWIFAAAFSVWVAYLFWGVTSPQIYDFRVAPFFGLLVAVCVRAKNTRSTPTGDLPHDSVEAPAAPTSSS